MVTIRYRIGSSVREDHWDAPRDVDLNNVEDHILEIYKRMNPAVLYRLDYLGRLSWDVFVDDRKVGHAHAADDRFERQAADLETDPSLFRDCEQP